MAYTCPRSDLHGSSSRNHWFGSQVKGDVSPGFTGVALLNLIQFNIALQSLITWCEWLDFAVSFLSQNTKYSLYT